MAFSLRMALLRGSPLIQTLIRQKSGSVVANVLFSKFAQIPKSPSLSRHFQQTLKQLQGNTINARRTLIFACSPLGVYFTINSTQFKSLCEQLKHRLSVFTARCEPCCPCGPYSALCQHGVVIRPPSCEERKKQTWKDSLIAMADVIFKSVLLCLQFFKLCILFTPVMLLYPIASFHCKLYQLWLWLMYKAVQWSGPVYIKLGQWAGTRRDLFSHAFCEKFSQLHAKMNYKPHPWKETEKILRKCYGKRWKETIKLDNDQEPIGSGCVAQVYKGYIHHSCIPQETLDSMGDCETLDDVYFKDGLEIQSLADAFTFFDGDDEPECYVAYPPNCGCLYENNPDYVHVAVKVLHPGIRERFALDLNLMNKVAWFMEFFMPSIGWVKLRECVKEFSIAMARQMDLTHEARALKRLCNDFSCNPNIKIPVPIMYLARRNVLVESFEDGKPMIEFVECPPHPCDYRGISLRRKMASIGVDALLHMVFNKNFAHSDLHPGNIYVQNSEHFQDSDGSVVMVDIGDTAVTTVNQTPCALRLVLLDVGITAKLSPCDHLKFRELFTAILTGQGYAAADLFLEKSICDCTSPCEFRHAMACLVERVKGASDCHCKINVSDLLSDIFKVLHTYQVRLESSFAQMIIAISILEGLGRSLDPHVDILKKTRELLCCGC